MSSEEVAEGKPAPDVYELALYKLNSAPESAIAIEDSTTGMEAAITAGVRTIVVPAPNNFHNPLFSKSYMKLSSLKSLGDNILDSIGKFLAENN